MKYRTEAERTCDTAENSSAKSLFREEAIQARLHRSLGSVRMNVPLPYGIVSYFSFFALISIFVFLFFFQISEKAELRGFLDTDPGLVKVRAPNSGQIIQSEVEEGSRVNKGDLLFVVVNLDQEKSKKMLVNSNQRIKNLKKAYRIKKEHYHALRLLYKKHYVSAAFLKETETDLLEIRNKIKLVDLENIQYKHRQYQEIRAPVDGRVTNVLYKKGQIIEPSNTLLQLIPQHAQFVARVYLPSQDIGFAKKNKELFIHYDAYPAQQFGVYKAEIKEINLTVLTDDKEDKPLKIGQPYYKIQAKLETDYVNVYGKKRHLSHGMTFGAVIRGDKKKIWQWILDPLYSYYGSL